MLVSTVGVSVFVWGLSRAHGSGIRFSGLGFWFWGSGVLGGSWVVISGVKSPLIWVISIVALLVKPYLQLPMNLQVEG